jgi:hypothetical protein
MHYAHDDDDLHDIGEVRDEKGGQSLTAFARLLSNGQRMPPR